MSNHTAQSFKDTNEKSRLSMHSVWMSRWSRTSYNVTAEAHNHVSNASGNKELDRVTRQYHSVSGLEACRSVKGHGGIETTTFEIMNKNLGVNSRNLRNEGLDGRFMPLVSHYTNGGSSSTATYGHGAEDKQTLGTSFSHDLKSGLAVQTTSGIQFSQVLPGAQATTGTSPTGFYYMSEGTSNSSPVGRTHSFAKDGNFVVSKPSQEYFIGASSHIVPYGFDNRKHEFNKGKKAISSFIDSSAMVFNNSLTNFGPRTVEHEHPNTNGKSAFLIYGGQMDSHLPSGSSRNPVFKESSTPLPLDAPSTDDCLPAFGRYFFQKMQRFSGTGPFPGQCSALEKTELKKPNHDCYSLEKLPKCIDDVETMKIYTTVDSSEGEPGSHSRFSKTTHSLLITKKSDVNLSNENDLANRRFFTKFNGNDTGDFHSISPYYGQGQHVKCQPLDCPIDSEGKENFEDVKASKVIIKNESSAETHTMDLDTLKEKIHFSAAKSTASNKVFLMDMNLLPQSNVASSREVGCHWSNIELIDRNLEIPASEAVETKTTDNAKPSSSRTQSLDMDVLMAHENPSNPKSKPVPDGTGKIDPSNRWLKRLKLSTSDSYAHGTKTSDWDENSSHDKMSKLLKKIIKDSITTSDPTSGNCHGKELMSNKTGHLPRKEELSYVDRTKNNKDLLLSHSWIQRWLHNGSTVNKKKSKSMVICEPQTSKLALENLQEKQLPSVAAMALMGKAMTGLQPRELQKRGTYVVWNTRAC